MSDKSLYEMWKESKRYVDYGFKATKGKPEKLKASQRRLIERYHAELYGTDKSSGLANGHKQYVQPRRKDRKKALQQSLEQGAGYGFPRLKGAWISTGSLDEKFKVRYGKDGKPRLRSKDKDGYRQYREFFNAKALAQDSDSEVQRVLAKIEPPDTKALQEVISIMVGAHEMHATLDRWQIQREVKRLMHTTAKGGSGLSPDIVRGVIFKHFPFIGTAKDYRERKQKALDKLKPRKLRNKGLTNRGGKNK